MNIMQNKMEKKLLRNYVTRRTCMNAQRPRNARLFVYHIDVSYHLWTFRTMDDSYHGLFVPSSDFSFRCENFSFFHILSIEGSD